MYGAVSTAKNNADYFYGMNRGASAHYFVDQKEIWQCVEDDNVAWHCGGAKVYYHDECRNANSIGIEMCCLKDKNDNLYMTEQTIRNTQELVKYLMKKYNIPIENVVRHYDVTHKICPAPFVTEPTKWYEFKKGLVGVINNVNEALELLVSNGRITDRNYWDMAIKTTRNVDFGLIKWANDLQELLNLKK